MAIEIKNKLLVVGNRVRVPGFEPLSEQTTNNLSLALQGADTFIDLDVALKLIPGSKVIITHNGGPSAGSFGHDKFFEIPSGPPPDGKTCPENKIRDVYKILQDYARVSLNGTGSDDIDCDISFNDSYSDFCDDFNKI